MPTIDLKHITSWACVSRGFKMVGHASVVLALLGVISLKGLV